MVSQLKRFKTPIFHFVIFIFSTAFTVSAQQKAAEPSGPKLIDSSESAEIGRVAQNIQSLLAEKNKNQPIRSTVEVISGEDGIKYYKVYVQEDKDPMLKRPPHDIHTFTLKVNAEGRVLGLAKHQAVKKIVDGELTVQTETTFYEKVTKEVSNLPFPSAAVVETFSKEDVWIKAENQDDANIRFSSSFPQPDQIDKRTGTVDYHEFYDSLTMNGKDRDFLAKMSLSEDAKLYQGIYGLFELEPIEPFPHPKEIKPIPLPQLPGYFEDQLRGDYQGLEQNTAAELEVQDSKVAQNAGPAKVLR